MGERMHELAGNLALGRKRLMEIARALCADPALLLLDEPAAGLRLKEKQALAAVLRQLRDEAWPAAGRARHGLRDEPVDRMVVMEFGTRLIEGTPAVVQDNPVVRAAYLGTATTEDQALGGAASDGSAARSPMSVRGLRASCQQGRGALGPGPDAAQGSVVTMIGHGAGKSTTQPTLMGVLPPGARICSTAATSSSPCRSRAVDGPAPGAGAREAMGCSRR